MLNTQLALNFLSSLSDIDNRSYYYWFNPANEMLLSQVSQSHWDILYKMVIINKEKAILINNH